MRVLNKFWKAWLIIFLIGHLPIKFPYWGWLLDEPNTFLIDYKRDRGCGSCPKGVILRGKLELRKIDLEEGLKTSQIKALNLGGELDKELREESRSILLIPLYLTNKIVVTGDVTGWYQDVCWGGEYAPAIDLKRYSFLYYPLFFTLPLIVQKGYFLFMLFSLLTLVAATIMAGLFIFVKKRVS